MSYKVTAPDAAEDPVHFGATFPDFTVSLDEELLGQFPGLKYELQIIGQRLVRQYADRYMQGDHSRVTGVEFESIDFHLLLGPETA